MIIDFLCPHFPLSEDSSPSQLPPPPPPPSIWSGAFLNGETNPRETLRLTREWTNKVESKYDSASKTSLHSAATAAAAAAATSSAPVNGKKSLLPTTDDVHTVSSYGKSALTSGIPTVLNAQTTGCNPTVLSFLPHTESEVQSSDVNPWIFSNGNETVAYFTPMSTGNAPLRDYQTLPIR